MAIKTELHLQRRGLIHQGHLIDRPVAVIAAYALTNVNAVVEVNVVRQLIDPRPLQRTSGTETLTHRFEIGGICPDLSVTVNAGLRRRNSSKRRLLDRSVAITAINTKAG